MPLNCEKIKEFHYPHAEKGEDYQLLAYISTLFLNKTFVVFGTSPEKTTRALSHNPVNKVITYSSTPFASKEPPIIIEKLVQVFHEANNNPEKKQELLKSSIIYVDIHPHEGKDEYTIYHYLREWGYKGWLILDDIWHFKSMRDVCWYRILDEFKYDLTDWGHWSGSGLVSFQSSFISSILPAKYTADKWTLVTAYFNLTKCPDASPEIHKRNKRYYLEHSVSTLSLPYNLVIYCDEESFSQIIKIRPSELARKTIYVILPFDLFEFNKKRTGTTFAEYREKIRENRISHPYEFDGRNTPSYYLFCMSRYIMLKQTIEKNPFQSTHFAWINFCMERMGIPNIRRLPEALSVERNKFSTCYIDYIPESFVQNTAVYFQRGLCSMCSGFFTGNGEFMYKVCDLIEDQFLEYLDQGWGHADEQLYSSVFFERPDLFEHYYGDYNEMITNYVHIYERPENPLRNFIHNSFRFGDFEICFKACKILWNSYKKDKCSLSQEQLEKLCFYYMMSGHHLKT